MKRDLGQVHCCREINLVVPAAEKYTAPMDTSVMQLLRRVIPFRFLSREYKEGLAGLLERVEYAAGDEIIRQGDLHDTAVFLIESGSVDAVDRRGREPRRINSIQSGHYFGEWEPLFRIPRRLSIVAHEATVCYRLCGEDFLQIISDSAEFSLALGTTLRDKQGIFEAFDRFSTEMLRSVSNGHISVAEMVPHYRRLEPALHPLVNSEREIDFGALNYAVRRLPDNVTRTFAFLMTDELPAVYEHPDAFFPVIPSTARRRAVWELLPGKDMILLRNGMSDLTDLLTCLCLYAVEARKIRRRLDHAEVLTAIESFLSDAATGVKDFLASLPFSEAEIQGLVQVWPGDTVSRLYEVVRHREMFSIDVRKQTTNWNSRRTDLWTAQIGAGLRDLIGHDPAEMPPDRAVHIISSNTHSVSNCLNPWFDGNRARILDWAADCEHPLLNEPWDNPSDKMYALVREFFRRFPEQQAESERVGREHGILTLTETASTGIQVQLIDCSSLNGAAIDPGISAIADDCQDIIVNIDYAFGEQAEHIMRNLMILFGANVRSINFLGKAGALTGKRGDILAPTAFVEQSSDLFQPLPAPSTRAVEDLQQRLPTRGIHLGPMLTVGGTLLQNRMMMHFYRSIWGCTGLEMEGTHYYRQVLESTQIGVIPKDVDLRFFYYVSDLPLETTASLSARMALSEGVPPLYAITRHILSDIFSAGTSPGHPAPVRLA